MSATQAEEDPTRTQTMRERWVAEYNSRWRDARGGVRSELSDGRGLVTDDIPDDLAETEFRSFLERQLNDDVVEPTPPSEYRRGAHWTGPRVRDAYDAGLSGAERELTAAGYTATTATVGAANGAHRERRRQQYVQAYTATQDASAATVSDATRAFRQARRANLAKSKVAQRVNGRLDAVGQTRTAVVANTTTVESANWAAIESYDAAGVERVEATVEWTTAGDNRVCPECQMLSGQTFSLSAVKSGDAPRPPVHPQCRCWLSPV